MKDIAPTQLTPYGIHYQTILRKASFAILYEEAFYTKRIPQIPTQGH